MSPPLIAQMASAIGIEKSELRPALDELVASYAADDRGMEIREVAGGFKFYTKPQHHEVVRRFIKSLRPPLRLTLSALETLAVIAYKQPVTQPEIQEIRGVNSSGVLQTLLEKRLITTAGRKAGDRPPDLVSHLEGFSDALWAFRCGRVAEPEGIRSARAAGAGHRRRNRADRAGRPGGNRGARPD